MDNAVTALQLVLCEDEERAAELAHKLNEINVARQETEQEIVLTIRIPKSKAPLSRSR